MHGSPADIALWESLNDLAIDDPSASFTFTDRLARDNGWSPSYASQVVSEYRKFIFLGQVAGHPVTPSDQVDQAWHLHLTYTRSYWDDLCGEVLGRALHHGPARGGPVEGAQLGDSYRRTLASYRRWFGIEPPTSVWPPAPDRFGEESHYVRVNTRRQWVVTKPERATSVARHTSLTVGASMLLAGCSGIGMLSVVAQPDAFATETVTAVLTLAVLGVVAITVMMLLRGLVSALTGDGRRSTDRPERVGTLRPLIDESSDDPRRRTGAEGGTGPGGDGADAA